MAKQSTRKSKPGKPYSDFPLFAHDSGRWAKKIKGRLEYFGQWARRVKGRLERVPDDGWQPALEKYQRERDYLHAGKRPPVDLEGLTVRDLCNHYMTAKKRQLDAGELKPKTYDDYFAACGRIVDTFGRDRLVSDLTPEDFGKLRASLVKIRNPVALGVEIQRTRSVFKYGYDADLLEKPVKFGGEFRKPAARTMRQTRNERAPRMFTREQVRSLLNAANPPMRAMVLLGVNAGLGNQDVAELPQSALDLKRGILEYPRPKTYIDRRATLWPETIKAIRAALADRPTHKRNADARLVFITKYGERYVRDNDSMTRIDSVGLVFGKLLRKLKIKERGVSFYALRHTFQTIGGEVGDQAAVDRISGRKQGLKWMVAMVNGAKNGLRW